MSEEGPQANRPQVRVVSHVVCPRVLCAFVRVGKTVIASVHAHVSPLPAA